MNGVILRKSGTCRETWQIRQMSEESTGFKANNSHLGRRKRSLFIFREGLCVDTISKLSAQDIKRVFQSH